MDLTFKFDNQEVVEAIGEVEGGDCLVLRLTANLKEEFGGALIIGKDVVIIKMPGDADGDGCVNLLDFSILKKTYGKSKGMSGYDKRADFDEDEGINLLDFSTLKNNYGECASD